MRSSLNSAPENYLLKQQENKLAQTNDETAEMRTSDTKLQSV